MFTGTSATPRSPEISKFSKFSSGSTRKTYLWSGLYVVLWRVWLTRCVEACPHSWKGFRDHQGAYSVRHDHHACSSGSLGWLPTVCIGTHLSMDLLQSRWWTDVVAVLTWIIHHVLWMWASLSGSIPEGFGDWPVVNPWRSETFVLISFTLLPNPLTQGATVVSTETYSM